MRGLVLLTFMLTVFQTESRLPGFKARITRNGIEYVNKVAQKVLADQLKTLKIPNQSGDSGDIEWTLTNIQNRGCTPPGSKLVLTPSENGLTWGLSNLALSIHADWWVKFHKGFIKISDDGSADIQVKGVSLKVTIKLGDDGKGRPSISMASCSANVADVDIDFHGGQAFILNLFRGVIGDKIRDVMKDQICGIVGQEVNNDGAEAMSKLQVTVSILDKFVLDYGIVQAPIVETNFLETSHKGEVYWINDMTEAPLSPMPLPVMAGDTRMVYFWLSQYTANTLAYVAQKHNFLQYNVTAADLPPAERSFLNTTCMLECIGTLIPQVGKAYPNSQVEMRGISTSTPKVTMTNTSITCDTTTDIGLYAHTHQGKTAFLLSLAMNLTMSIQVSIVDEKVMAKVIDHRFHVAVLKSAVGSVDGKLLNLMLGGVLTLIVFPEVNGIGAKGIDLPVTDDVKFESTSVSLLNGSIVISTDLQYSSYKPSQALKFQSEHQSIYSNMH